jgi:hypothetical protein
MEFLPVVFRAAGSSGGPTQVHGVHPFAGGLRCTPAVRERGEPMTSIAILLGTPGGPCVMAAASERDAARFAEEALLRIDPAALPIPVWIQCADRGVADRLRGYLAEFQAEMAAEGCDAAPDEPPSRS